MNVQEITASSKIKNIIKPLIVKQGALLPILHAIQNEFSYIPEQAIPLIAQALKQTSAEIHGVISFYHQFKTSPLGQYHLQICRAEACQARGSRKLEKYTKELLNINYHEVTTNQKITLSPVYCLGNCATGPNIRINDRLVGRVSHEKMTQIVKTIEESQS